MDMRVDMLIKGNFVQIAGVADILKPLKDNNIKVAIPSSSPIGFINENNEE